MKGVEILLSDARGVYIPRDFVSEFDMADWGIPLSTATMCRNPEGESYWDTWHDILQMASHTDSKGNVWTLWQDGNLFAICDELMSDEEYEEFFGEARCS